MLVTRSCRRPQPPLCLPYMVSLAFVALITGTVASQNTQEKAGSLSEVDNHLTSKNASTFLGAMDIQGGLLPGDLFVREDTSRYYFGQTGGSLSFSSSDDYTCGPQKPCPNGACCGPSGWCGYGSAYCGQGCQSNCEAKAECGTYADPPGKICPLNACCSKYGFCGLGSNFCGESCQSNCQPPKLSVKKTNVDRKIIAYWEGWNSSLSCRTMYLDQIPSMQEEPNCTAELTIGSSITTKDGFGPELFRQVSFLKNKNVDLKIMVTLGGGMLRDPGKWHPQFSDMVSTLSNRQKAIRNMLGFLNQYGFDGIDLDWECPNANDCGEKQDESDNYAQFLRELRATIRREGRDYLVTFTAPTSYRCLRSLDLATMVQYVDWINLKSDGLHGAWNRNESVEMPVQAHASLPDMDLTLDLLWRNNIDPSSIVMGVGSYGRSYKLKNPKCWKPGCKSNGPGDKGRCTGQAGILSYREIQDIITSTNAKPMYDQEAKVNYLVYGQNNWVSFDDKRTFRDKANFAKERGLGGLMIWGIDLDGPQRSALYALRGSTMPPMSPLATEGRGQTIVRSANDPTQCIVTECGGICSQSQTAVGRSGAGCMSESQARWICCPAWTSTNSDHCYWNVGLRGTPADCAGKCNTGDVQVTSDSNGWTGDLKTGTKGEVCLRGSKAFCCKTEGTQDQPKTRGSDRNDSPPVNLDRIFPPEYLPPPDSVARFELLPFHRGIETGDEDPDKAGFAFFLMAGSEKAVTSMNKRDNQGLHFLSCPQDVLGKPHEEPQTARVVCLSGDVDSCFGLRKDGVEGTIVHMPDECGAGSWTRAVSLGLSQDQLVPAELTLEGQDSAVYDFTFDYNIALVRRDAGRISIRIDYSNLAGYWKNIVDSPGNNTQNLQELIKAHYPPSLEDSAGESEKMARDKSASTPTIIQEDITQLLYHQTQLCPTCEGHKHQGIAIAIEGNANMNLYYGFSMIATWDPADKLEVHDAAGFIHVDGTTSASFKAGSNGVRFDTTKKLKGGAIEEMFGKTSLDGHSVYHGWASFAPYLQKGAKLKTSGAKSDAVVFNGYVEASAVADWGSDVNVHFPGDLSGIKSKDMAVSRSSKSNLKPLKRPSPRSSLAVANVLEVGLKVDLSFPDPWSSAVAGGLPDMSVTQTVAAVFEFEGSKDAMCLDTKVALRNDATMRSGESVGWGDGYERQYIAELKHVGSTQCWDQTGRNINPGKRKWWF